MASEALASHRVSFRSDWSSAVAKYFDPEGGGCPSGLSKPTEIKTEMSCSVKPRNQAVSVMLRRAGGMTRVRKSFFSCCISLLQRIRPEPPRGALAPDHPASERKCGK